MPATHGGKRSGYCRLALLSGFSCNEPIPTPESGPVTSGPAAWEVAGSLSLMWHRHSYTEDPEGPRCAPGLMCIISLDLPTALLRTWLLHPFHSQGNRGLVLCGHLSIHHGSGGRTVTPLQTRVSAGLDSSISFSAGAWPMAHMSVTPGDTAGQRHC